MTEKIISHFWRETPTASDAYSASACHCYGYDVYADLLGKASWQEYCYLLLTGRRAKDWQAQLLHELAIILTNPGPRDHSVLAAMNAGISGSTSASCLMAALSVGAGQYSGAHEIYHGLQIWRQVGLNIHGWLQQEFEFEDNPIWKSMEHIPGFNPYIEDCPMPVRQSLRHLINIHEDPTNSALYLLHRHQRELELSFASSLAMSGVAIAAFFDLGLDEQQAEMLYLILRLPGAAAHALEQRQLGWRHFPFYPEGIHYTAKKDEYEKT